MARLLETRLPLATEPEVRKDIFNKLIRVLELNLGAYDTNATPAFIVSKRDQLKFNDGDVIWNLN